MKHPYMPLYTGDWKKDPDLSLCSTSTRGVWIDMLCSMHDGHIGQVTGTPEQLARLCRCNAAEMQSALLELQATRAANVSERDGIFSVVCRRMQKAIALSKTRANAGSKGGANSKQRQKRPDTDNDIECCRLIEEYCKEIGLPSTDGSACFNKWEGNGWTNRGEPIKDWKATIRSWKLQGYMPSQRTDRNGNKRPLTRDEEVAKQLEKDPVWQDIQRRSAERKRKKEQDEQSAHQRS